MPAQTSNPTSQLPAPRSFEGVSDRLAEARAADERWRGDRTKEGATGGPHTCSSPISRPRTASPFSQLTRSLTRKGFLSGRAEPCYRHAAFLSPGVLMLAESEGGLLTLAAAGRTLAGSAIMRRRGRGP